MFKKLIIFMAFILSAGTCLADSTDSKKVETALNSSKGTSLTLNGTGLDYSRAFPVASVKPTESVGIMYKATGSSIDGKLEFQQSYAKPTTEGTDDTVWLTTHLIDSSVTDENWHMATIDSVVMFYGRFKVEGNSGNGGGNSIQIKVVKP